MYFSAKHVCKTNFRMKDEYHCCINRTITKNILRCYILSILTKLYPNVNVIEVGVCCRWWGESFYSLLVNNLLSCWASQTNSNRQIERPRSLRDYPATIAFLWTATGVVGVMLKGDPSARIWAFNLDLCDRPRPIGVDSGECEIVRPSTIPKPYIHITKLGALYSPITCWNDTIIERTIAL